MSPPTEYRMKLNNFLQAHGGAARLSWGEPIKGGQDNSPNWTVYAFLDGNEFCYATGGSKDIAKEEAARKVLRHLLAPGFNA